ncbi:hypothetical protein J6590_043211 [Homalodisca vitripennis]|nr:hypothetical protein J6590_043211 [Homalodisca vitripennis]
MYIHVSCRDATARLQPSGIRLYPSLVAGIAARSLCGAGVAMAPPQNHAGTSCGRPIQFRRLCSLLFVHKEVNMPDVDPLGVQWFAATRAGPLLRRGFVGMGV